MRAGKHFAFRGDGDVALPAAAAGDVGLVVREKSQVGPLAAEGRIDVQPDGGPAHHEGTDARGRGVEIIGGREAGPIDPCQVAPWGAEG